MTGFPIDELRTARLLLTRMREEDLPDLRGMYLNSRVMATLGGLRSEEQTKALLRAHFAHWEEHGFGWWVARDLSTGVFAGRGGLRRRMIGGMDEVEVGYAFLPEFWGRGLATELAAEGVRVGFEVLGLAELVSITLPTNRASRRVMEKVGFRYERDIVHADLPHVLYRLAASR
jgi:RimJ/RimL family protein N-acetyltransferase